MSAEIDDGGSAFPQPLAFDPANGNPVTADMYFAKVSGMTLRDWFAGQAMMGILSEGGSPICWRDDAENAYKAADAMIRARKGGADANR